MNIIPLVRQVACIKTEIGRLDRVRTRLLKPPRMEAAAADVSEQIEEMRAVLATLEKLQSQDFPEIGLSQENERLRTYGSEQR